MDFFKKILYNCISVFMINIRLVIPVETVHLENLAKPAKNFLTCSAAISIIPPQFIRIH